MDYNSAEYLNLFKTIKEENNQVNNNYGEMITEKPNYNNYGSMITETPDYNNYKPSSNLNSINEVQNFDQFTVETTINGQPQRQNQNLNECYRSNEDKESRLNEIMQQRRFEQQRLNEIKEQERLNELKKQENAKLNEAVKFSDTNIVSVEMFNRASINSMMQVTRSW